MVENVPPRQVWEALRKDPKAQLVDVRTDAEWNFVGLPDLSSAGKQVVPIQWQVYPTMARNTAFADQLKEAGFTAEHHIYFICRSGQRSLPPRRPLRQRVFRTPTMSLMGSKAVSMPRAIAGWRADGRPRGCLGGNDRQLVTFQRCAHIHSARQRSGISQSQPWPVGPPCEGDCPDPERIGDDSAVSSFRSGTIPRDG